jgi:hypothetical protein
VTVTTAKKFSQHCLVTERALSELDQQFGQGVQECIQKRQFKKARELWQQAREDGKLFPVVFLDASQGGIVYWGVIDRIEFVGDNNTRLSYMLLEKLPKLPHSELIVQSTHNPLPKDYIRAYVICETPAFVR